MAPGPYRHFKGGRYSVLMTAKDSETQLPTVVYISLDNGSVWVRPLAMWHEEVDWPDGTRRPRFELEAPLRVSLATNLADP